MTNMKLASTLLALIASAIAMTLNSGAAQARTRHQDNPITPFDRHAVEIGARMFIRDVGARKVTHTKQTRKKHERRPREHSISTSAGGHLLVASSGAKTSVSTVARPHFQCLLTKLESGGYHIDFMGGYASRGNASAHPTGNALDINQTARNVVTRRLPANINEMASDCGLVHGKTWAHNPDQGHFEMPRKYGYIFRHHRTRYAAR